MMKKNYMKIFIFTVSLVLLLLTPKVIDNPYVLHIFILIFLNVSLGLAWNIIGGYAGQYSIGHAVFYGVGAYSVFILMSKYQVSPWLGFLVGLFFAVLVALVIGLICFRLRGPYFVLASISVGEIFHIAAMNLQSLTNGGQGILINDLAPIQFGDFLITDFTTKVPFYYLALALGLLGLAVNYKVARSKMGYYLQAIREDQDAAESLGISLPRYKNAALIVSAMLTSLAGALSALYVGFIDPPTVLSIDLSISIVLICIIGGIGTLLGPVVGAIIIVSLSEILRSNLIPQWLFQSGLVSVDSKVGVFLNEQIAHAHVLIYGILVVVVILFMPQGVVGFIKKKLVHARSELVP